jgi:tetratricopeptide (TPR) repeat protein
MPKPDKINPDQSPIEDHTVENETEETQKNLITELQREAVDETPSVSDGKPRKRTLRIILLGLLGIIILGALGGLGGYWTALNDREANQSRVISTEVSDQFLLGLIAFERGQYEVARQHFEYIIKIDPENSAAADQLTQVILKMNQADVAPTERPTATLTPTLDTRDQEDLFAIALEYRDQMDWDNLLYALDNLRVRSPDFHAVEVDGLYYIAYRNRGMQRIQVEGNLESGIFDLNRAEQFGLLDVEASNYRNWASKYITGSSFWEVDWEQVVNYFGPLAISAPFLSDSTFFTAQDRLATAQVEVNLQVLSTARSRYSQDRWCDAYDLFNEASQYIQFSQNDLEKFEDAKNKCFGIEPTSAPTATATPEQ